ncbi:hypothetical protein JCM3774_005090 [Rhodotorula dairenensis]
MAPPRANRRRTLAPAPCPPPLSWLVLATAFTALAANANAQPTPSPTAVDHALASSQGPGGGSRGVHVPLLRRNGHLRALARTPSQQDQQDIVAGWALREKGRVTVKYGLEPATVSFDKRGDARSQDSDEDDQDAESPPDDGAATPPGQRRKGRRKLPSLAEGDAADDEDAWSIARRQLAGPNGGQLGTTASPTTTTRTALSTAGYGTATRVSAGSASSVNSATKTAPTTFPGPTQTVPVGEVHLLNYDADLSYYAPIGIGVPAQYMNCILDTGSADLWIASNYCTSSTGCSSTVPLFNSSLSRTQVDMNTSFSVRYGSGQAQGEMMQDFVAFAGYNVSSQAFALVESVSQDLLGGEISGLMGLGWQPLAASQAVPWWQNLYQGGALPFAGFAVSLSRFINVPNASAIEPGGSLTFGYLNSSLYSSEINYVPLPSGQESYWLVRMDQVAVNGTNVTAWATGNGEMVAIDTGTTLIGGPKDVISNIYAQVPGARAATGAYTGYYSYPCSANVSVGLTFGGVTYNMSTADFNLGPFGIDARTNVSTCLGAFFDLAFSGGSRISWVIGAAFLKNVYTVYRADPPAVGFATLSNSSHPMPFYPSNSSDPAHDGNLTAIPGGIYGPSGAATTAGAGAGANAGVRTTLVAANTVTTAVAGQTGMSSGALLRYGGDGVIPRAGMSVAVASMVGFGIGLLY